jgi:hypothetical protein
MNRRTAVAVVLLSLLALEILPCSYQEAPTAATIASGRFACCFEPLRVCDQGDPLLGSLGNLSVLVATANVVFPSFAILGSFPENAVVLPAGIKSAIDHPPELSA